MTVECETWLSFSKNVFFSKKCLQDCQKSWVLGSNELMLVSNQPILETSLPSLTKNLWFLSLGHFHADSPISSKQLERIRELEALGKKEQTLVCFWRRVIPGTPNNGSQYGKGLPLLEVPENPTWFLLDWKLGWWQLFVDVLSVNNYKDSTRDVAAIFRCCSSIIAASRVPLACSFESISFWPSNVIFWLSAWLKMQPCSRGESWI